MSTVIPNYTQIDTNYISFSNLSIANDKQFFFSRLHIKKNNIFIQVDGLVFNEIILDDDGIYYSVFKIMDNNFYKFILNLEKQVILTVKKNSIKWFGKEVCTNIKDIYKSVLMIPDNIYDYPKIKIRIVVKNGNIKSKFFNANGKQIKMIDIKSNNKINIIFNLNSLNFHTTLFFIDISLYQLQFIDNNYLEILNNLSDSDNDIILSDSDNDIILSDNI